jgi:hypothetical protein
MKTLSKLLSGAALALILSSCGSTEPYPGLVARPLPFPLPEARPDYSRLVDLPGLGGIDRSIFAPRPTPRLSPDAARVITPAPALRTALSGPAIPPFPRFPRF